MKPMPRITEFDRPFWEACNEEKLLLQRCQAADCGHFIFYPRVCCPYCGRGNPAWTEASGRGTLRSYTVLHHAQHESFDAELPYCFIAVDLAEGPTMFSRLEAVPASQNVVLGCPVEAYFVAHTPDQKLPFFRLV
jgi:uncharacterized OB-fold protein